jgi:hypothetical protein
LRGADPRNLASGSRSGLVTSTDRWYKSRVISRPTGETHVSIVRRTVVAATAAAIAVTAFPHAAAAAGSSRHCPAIACSVTVNFPGGTLSVDVDAGNVAGTVGTFKVWRNGASAIACQGTFPGPGGVRSYVCRGLPAGTYNGLVQGPAPTAVGLRW